MEKIVKKDGKVYLEESYGPDGRHKTITCLGMDPDYMSPETKINKRKKSED